MHAGPSQGAGQCLVTARVPRGMLGKVQEETAFLHPQGKEADIWDSRSIYRQSASALPNKGLAAAH